MKDTKRLDGILVVDKPKGLSSTQTLEEVKRLLRVKKAGHGGTLDQIATGVLPLFLNSATKVAQIFLEGDKVYEGEFILGLTTLTYDITGEKVSEKTPPDLSVEELQKVADQFVGELEQIPPPYSAAKFKGRPLYKYARDGLLITKEPKKIKVYEFKILGKEGERVRFRLHCSKGTYVRSIVNEFGSRLECGAALSELRRTKKSIFTLKDAITLEKLKELVESSPEEVEKLIIPVQKALEFLPRITISEEFSQKVRTGRQLYTTAFLSFMKFQKLRIPPSEKWIRLVTARGKLVAIIENPLLNPSRPYISYFRVFKD
jgi:tRNA pseudouridine55 synthase